MTDNQQIFCDEYLKDRNASRAYRVAYPNVKSEGAARACSARLLTRDSVKSYIDKRLAEMKSAAVADAQEIQEYLTSVIRKQSRAPVVVVEGTGEGCSEARLLEKPPDEKERMKAVEILARLLGLGKNNILDVIPVQILNDIPEQVQKDGTSAD